MSLLKDLDAAALQAVLDRLRKMAPRPSPDPASLVTEEGRIKYAEERARHAVVIDLENAIKSKLQE